jgi:hypothetical protein
MNANPPEQSINASRLKLAVGFFALTLASVTNLFASSDLPSISASYYEEGVSRTFFIGALFMIAVFLFAYTGSSRAETVSSRVASLAALGVLFAPCECGNRTIASSNIIPFLHYLSAATMFLVLTFFCYRFWRAARSQRYAQARLRAGIYALCGLAIAVAIVILLMDTLTHQSIGQNHPRLTFYMEQAALAAFGISWLAASEALPLVTRPDERTSLLSFSAMTQELSDLVAEARKPNLSRERIDQLSSQHKDIAGRMVRLQEVESGLRLAILVAVALLISGIVQEFFRLHW